MEVRGEGGWMGPRVGLDVMEKRKSLATKHFIRSQYKESGT
jgi:hypothetical protein